VPLTGPARRKALRDAGSNPASSNKAFTTLHQASSIEAAWEEVPAASLMPKLRLKTNLWNIGADTAYCI
jgi:hypothetical protein